MYVTRPLSMYQKDPSMLSLPPPDGPNSGILIIQDEESEPTGCFRWSKSHELKNLPFPQNKNLKLRFTTISENSGINGAKKTRGHISKFHTAFIPVLNQPLASNCYYAICSKGKHKGKAYSNSTGKEMGTCCFCTYVRKVAPQPLNPNNMLQQFEVQCNKGGFVATSIESDAIPPIFLGREGWKVLTSTPSKVYLHEAQGLNATLRSSLPDFNFDVSKASSDSVVVGKWYCPFMFVKEGSLTVKDQMRSTRFYEMTLEQKWEQIYACDMVKSEDTNSVIVDVSVENEFVKIGIDVEVVHEEKDEANGVMWYKGLNNVGGESKVGLSLAILERVKWEKLMFGWNGGDKRKVVVRKIEEFGGREKWKKFGCYVLVERFVLKRRDGSLVLTCGFRHINRIRCIWVT